LKLPNEYLESRIFGVKEYLGSNIWAQSKIKFTGSDVPKPIPLKQHQSVIASPLL
jgi:hypothetical protein